MAPGAGPDARTDMQSSYEIRREVGHVPDKYVTDAPILRQKSGNPLFCL